MDADGQHDPHLIELLLAKLQEGYDMECADRQIAHKEKLRYLNDHPEWRTVPHIDTPGHTGQIIIK